MPAIAFEKNKARITNNIATIKKGVTIYQTIAPKITIQFDKQPSQIIEKNKKTNVSNISKISCIDIDDDKYTQQVKCNDFPISKNITITRINASTIELAYT